MDTFDTNIEPLLLASARQNASLAAEAQARFAQHPSRFNAQHRVAPVLAAIAMSTAWMEARINWLIYEASNPRFGPKGELAKHLSIYWQATRSGHSFLLDKYKAVLDIVDAKPFNEGSNPYQDAFLVVQLRNFVVHNKPDKRTPKDWEGALRGKFELRPTPQEQSEDPFFPDRVMGAGCADWAVTSATAFVESFMGRLHERFREG